MRNVLAKSAALGLALLAAAPDGQAQTADRKFAIGLNANAFQYKGNLGSDFWDASRAKWGPGISFSMYLTPGLDISLNGNYGELKKTGDFGTNFATNIVNANVGLKLKLNNGWALKEDAVIQPYLLVAPGLLYTSREGVYNINGQSIDLARDKNYFSVLAAAGINFRLSEAVGLFIQTGQTVGYKADFDGNPNRDSDGFDDRFLQHTAGLTVALGKAKDTDGDGVPDRKDKCPDTPAGVAVDPNGCPLDGDGDGVPDYQDKCPTEKGLATLEGCPDRDGDGVRDGDDACPDQAGLPALRGCPDSDGDGVTDANDKCPGTPAGTQVDATGCPLVTDADGDGVPDNLDKCPGTPAGSTVDSTGCRVIDPALMNKVKPVQFETNSTVLRKSSYPTLDNVITILNQYPEYSVRISGHADSRGTDEYNQGLSERRAASAKRYFTNKKMDPNRVTTEGFGESQPAAPNTSKAGQAKNRRVEFKFEFYIPSAPQP
ncbi:OmpA family protein [Hymenobacter cavernae]|uniref:OmpA family protein n=1 Tax=Hymenobacter cavernae TaxID=2044852 RepID=UPI001667A978|nr:OmpA family protein [Hymenobacter cavernae]